MIQKIRNQNISHKAFTLIEMVIVLVIIWILLMMTLHLSWEQIQKVKDKTVKESILAEMQSRYSRNLWSSSFAWMIYDTMDVTFSSWSNEIGFKYNPRNGGDSRENTFSNSFEIKYLTTNYDYDGKPIESPENITLKYSPYQISCKIWDEKNKNVVILARVNDSRNYCFEISQKNCRLAEISGSKCENLKILAKIDS
jgi:prepilin-type N-terminal cleavage/methylation domain-containing protein